MLSVSIVINGQVQGVGFRAYVLDLADRLGVSGEVWNRRDGAVEALAAHQNQNVLDEFVQSLNRGPGRVSGVSSIPVQGYSADGFSLSRSR